MQCLAPVWLLAAALGWASPVDAPTFERDIRPILSKRCTVCHNAGELADLDTSGGLALDSFDAAMKGTAKHKVVVPGKANESRLFSRLSESDEDLRMPLSDTPLDPSQRNLIRRWIEAGAVRGESPTAAGVSANRPTRRILRTADVAIPFAATPPRNTPIELRLKIGPLPAVASVAFGEDGTTLAVGTYGQIAIWDLEEREAVRFLDDIPGPVLALALSPDGKTLAAGGGLPARSGVVRLYAMPGGAPIRTLEGHRDVVSGLTFRPDGKALATASYDATVRFWDLESGKSTGVFSGHSDFVYEVAYLPDGKSTLSTSKDRTIKRVDATTATEMRTYGEHDEDVLALAVRPDGSGFVTSGVEPQIRSWTLDSEKSSKKVSVHGGPVHQLAFSRDGKRLVSASGDMSVRVFDGLTVAPQRTLPGPTEWQYAVAMSRDGKRVAGGGWDGVVRVWAADTSALEMVLLQPPSPSPGLPEWLAIGPDGTLSGSADLRDAARWTVGGKELRVLPDVAAPSKPK